MSIHEKMNSDYLWIRNTPVEEGRLIKNHGLYFFYDRGPNVLERYECTYRSMGQQVDWELEKHRQNWKGVDKGNKWRLWKNWVRVLKHPIGYIYWKTYKWDPFFAWPYFVFGSFVLLVVLIKDWGVYNDTIRASDQLLLRLGKNVEGSMGRMKGYQETTSLRDGRLLHGIVRKPLLPNQVQINPIWKQNLRKELQMTNRHLVCF